jgi:hypothetical protein
LSFWWERERVLLLLMQVQLIIDQNIGPDKSFHCGEGLRHISTHLHFVFQRHLVK